ncbi:hypothetical protein LTR62_004927 [Meristemomyces frigidus]|uniref:N-acetyltransferase domain-containing protein n=1 Tax=Meristemomyces frigidus TaxID=1508187 RepID=A0AAN7TE21_9PEZI|nr:hypothetical protein LTR62_004927 [Meristemomyces frigidus]
MTATTLPPLHKPVQSHASLASSNTAPAISESAAPATDIALPSSGNALPPDLRAKAKGSLPASQDQEAKPDPPGATIREDSGTSVKGMPTSSGNEYVRNKLSQMGVTVTAARKVSSSDLEKLDRESADLRGFQVVSRVRFPGSDRGGARGRGRGGSTRGQGNRRPDASSSGQPPLRNNYQTGRQTTGNIGSRGRSRGNAWPNKKDMKADPNRWKTTWSSDGARTTSSSGGWGEEARKSHGKGRNDLADWSGGWAPAPLDWDCRPGFADTRKLARIESWLDHVATDGARVPLQLIKDDQEFAPRSWAPLVIDNKAPHTFFKDLMASNNPSPLNEQDLHGARPWWELYKSRDASLLLPYVHPNIAGADPDESLEERLAREADHGASAHTENRKRFEKAKRVAAAEKKARLEACGKKASNRVNTVGQVKPEITGTYVRSAKLSDMEQVRNLYNYYITCTCLVPETGKRTTADMEQIFRGISENKLPFLVACERSRKLHTRKSRKNRRCDDGEEVWVPEKIIGFAHVDDFHDPRGMYSHTCEIEIYIHSDLYMKGMGSCLLDKLLGMLDESYVERGGYEIEGEELEAGWNGISPRIENVITYVPYEKLQRLEWMGRWLKTNEFKQVTALDGVGKKYGENVDLAVFLRKMGVSTDVANSLITSA